MSTGQTDPPGKEQKRTRTSNGRSSIYQDAGGRWHGRVTMGVRDDGSPDRRHVRGKNEKEVTDKVRKLERERDKGNAANAGKAPTVEEWMTTYLDTIAARTLAPRSLDDYRSKARNWIVPAIGKHRLDRLLPEHLDKLYASMRAAGKAESHALKVHRVLSRALEVAVRRGKVSRNVAKLVDPPSAAADEIQPLSEGEARRLLTAAVELPRNGARWSVALALGLRQGEALGLRWSYNRPGRRRGQGLVAAAAPEVAARVRRRSRLRQAAAQGQAVSQVMQGPQARLPAAVPAGLRRARQLVP